MQRKVLFTALSSLMVLIGSCSPLEEEVITCINSWECGDGWVCEEGFCIEASDTGTGTIDTATDNDGAVPEMTGPESEETIGADDEELVDELIDLSSDENDGEIGPDNAADELVGNDETGDGEQPDELVTDDPVATDDLPDEATEATEADDAGEVETMVDEDIVDEDAVDLSPDLDIDVPDDDTAPTIVSTVPVDNATGVAVTAKVEVHFSEALSTSSIAGNFTIMQGATDIPFSAMWRSLDNTVILTPDTAFSAGLLYEVTVKTGVADPAGNHLAAQYLFDFTTSACGNNVVDEGLGEVCDDGVNDGAYGGCMPGCMAFAPYCGDGILTAGSEVCDTALSVACNELGSGYANSDIAVCSLGCQGLETEVCVCASGYKKDGGGACIDIDECAENTDGCAQNCQNTDGGHTCSCNSGYTLNADGHACDNIDECTENDNPCNDNGDTVATCNDATPGYSCTCSGGYVESGGTCILDNPCGGGWTHNAATGKCYQYIATAATWPNAKSGCAGLGGRLVDIADATENAYVANLMPDGTHAWIGLNDYPTAVTANGGNPSCGTPEPVASRGGVYYGTTSSNNKTETCGYDMPGYDEYFRITTLADYNGNWTVKAYPVSSSNDFALFIDTNCSSYLYCNDAGGNGAIETLTYSLSASTVYYVYIDSYSTAARDYYIEFLPPSGKLPSLPSGQQRAFSWDGDNITYDNTAFVNFLSPSEPNFNSPGSGSDSKYREVRCVGQQRYSGAANGATWYDDPCTLTKPYLCEK